MRVFNSKRGALPFDGVLRGDDDPLEEEEEAEAGTNTFFFGDTNEEEDQGFLTGEVIGEFWLLLEIEDATTTLVEETPTIFGVSLIASFSSR